MERTADASGADGWLMMSTSVFIKEISSHRRGQRSCGDVINHKTENSYVPNLACHHRRGDGKNKDAVLIADRNAAGWCGHRSRSP